MEETSNKIALIYDYGMFLEFARTLSKSFKKVYYYCHWENSFPSSLQKEIGYGFKEFEKVYNFFDYVDIADIIIFPDIYTSDIQTFLESKGKLVWGARKGEEMELDRDAMFKHMQSLGLYVSPYVICNGMTDLRNYLQKNREVWVKGSSVRNDFETFFSTNYNYICPLLDEIECNLGALSELQKFIVQQPYENAVETGCDLYTIDGKYPKQTLAGIEVKGLGYVGKILKYSQLPEEITDFNTKMSDTFAKYNYRGFLSTEIRVSEEKPPFMVDLCCRAGSPPSELYQLMYKNLAEIIWKGAQGNCIDPITEHKFGVQVTIKSTHCEKNWQNIVFPKEYRDNIKLHNAMFINGKYWIAPQPSGFTKIGSVVAEGDTMEEAIQNCINVCDSIEGYGIDIKLDTIAKAKEEFKIMKQMGIKIM
jgi:hypothetical protein